MTMLTGKQRNFQRIGVLIGDPNGDYEHLVLEGIVEMARLNQVEVVVYVSTSIDLHYRESVSDLVLHEMLTPEAIDGLIVSTGILTGLKEEESFSKLLQHYQTKPIVSLSIPLYNAPTITIDNYNSMRQVVMHMLEAGRKKIAFIGGPMTHIEANLRHQSFIDVLKEQNIPLDPTFLFEGDFSEQSGRDAVVALLEDPQAAFDGIVAASDRIAIGAIKELTARGYRVPEDIAVTGFDDAEATRFMSPRLTTVSQPLYNFGITAFKTVLKLIQGKSVPQTISLEGTLKVRDSSGYVQQSFEQFEGEQLRAKTEERIQVLITSALDDRKLALPVMSTSDLMASFIESCETGTNLFTEKLRLVIEKTSVHKSDTTVWLTIVDLFAQFGKRYFSTAEHLLTMKEICCEIGNELNQIAFSQYNALRVTDSLSTSQFDEYSRLLMYALSLEELTQSISFVLKQLDIERTYISLFQESRSGLKSRLLVSYEKDRGGSIHLDELVLFPVDKILPDAASLGDKPLNWIVEPLHYQDEVLGVAVIQLDRKRLNVYEGLRLHLANALKTLLLLEEVRDHSELLELEVANRTKELERIVLDRNEMLGVVSHDLRSPLSSLQLSLTMLEQKIDELPPESVARFLSRSLRNAENMQTIMARLLDVSRIESNAFTVDLQPVDVNELLDWAVSSHEEAAAKKQITFELVHAKCDCLMLADNMLVQQTIANLISNALKYSPENTTVVISAIRHEKEYTISITDQGLGLSADDLSKLFGKYTRLSAKPTGGESSTGLGLYIVKKVVRAMNGRIKATSDGKGKGSVFTIALPLADVPTDTFADF